MRKREFEGLPDAEEKLVAALQKEIPFVFDAPEVDGEQFAWAMFHFSELNTERAMEGRIPRSAIKAYAIEDLGMDDEADIQFFIRIIRGLDEHILAKSRDKTEQHNNQTAAPSNKINKADFDRKTGRTGKQL